MNQPTFADLDYESKGERLAGGRSSLERMDGLIPWEELERAHSTVLSQGRSWSAALRVIGDATDTSLRAVVRVYTGLSDPGMEDMLYEVESVRGS